MLEPQLKVRCGALMLTDNEGRYRGQERSRKYSTYHKFQCYHGIGETQVLGVDEGDEIAIQSARRQGSHHLERPGEDEP